MKRHIIFTATTLLAFCNGVTAFVPLAVTQTKPSVGAVVTSSSTWRSSPSSSLSLLSSTRSVQKKSLSTATSLPMAPIPAASIAAIGGAFAGGLFAGSLHAIAGPDHLAALLPRCCGQRWYKAGRVGALWGMGHGLSAGLLGVAAFGLKKQVKHIGGNAVRVLSGMSHATEIAVGLSLILIGLMGIKEAREWEDEMIEGGQPQSLSAAAADAGIKTAQKRAVIFNGILHGFTWDGAPSLAPALAVATWSGNLAFLSAYAVGTTMAMMVATTLIGEATRRAGQVLHRPDIPQKLSLLSSFVAIAVGLVWSALALK